MKPRRPRSLNGLILVGFAIVAVPLLLAVIWALVNLDRVAEQSEQLVFTGVAAAENNRRLAEQVGSLDRSARQFQVLRNPDLLVLLQQDLEALDAQLFEMQPLAEKAQASALATSIGRGARGIVETLAAEPYDEVRVAAAVARFGPLRDRVTDLASILTSYGDNELSVLRESAR